MQNCDHGTQTPKGPPSTLLKPLPSLPVQGQGAPSSLPSGRIPTSSHTPEPCLVSPQTPTLNVLASKRAQSSWPRHLTAMSHRAPKPKERRKAAPGSGGSCMLPPPPHLQTRNGLPGSHRRQSQGNHLGGALPAPRGAWVPLPWPAGTAVSPHPRPAQGPAHGLFPAPGPQPSPPHANTKLPAGSGSPHPTLPRPDKQIRQARGLRTAALGGRVGGPG